MSRFIQRLEKNIEKLEKRMEKEQQKIDSLREKCECKKITKAQFNIKKRHCEENIKTMSSRMRVLQGGITREKRHLEEKAEEKQKKKEKKEKKKKKKEE